jgi:FtsP/CotA-like multicopper oxidase with cupredoxin domain
VHLLHGASFAAAVHLKGFRQRKRKETPMRMRLASIVSALGICVTALAARAAEPLPGTSIPQFVEPLPPLDVISGVTDLELRMTEFRAQVLPTGFPKTWVWGYLKPGQSERASFLGPVIVAERGTPLQVRWVNALGDTATTHLRWWSAAADQTLHFADPLHGEMNPCAEGFEPDEVPSGECAQPYSGAIPAVTHLHGGEVPSAVDGGPDAWFTSDGVFHGPAYYSRDAGSTNDAVARYPNTQEAAPLWFHDHALGLTRLNVYAGLAGAYLLTDPANPPPPNLPAPIPLVIQDRLFDRDGQLVFPAGVPYIPNPTHPFWVPELMGDTIVVNGKAWPYLEVEPKRYRFLILNGSNARGYEMFLANRKTDAPGPAMWQIGTDGGYLDAPVKIDPAAKSKLPHLVLLPGERADVIVDFSKLAPGTRLLLKNVAKAPYPHGEAPHGNTTGRILEIRVGAASGADGSYDPASGAPLRAPMVRLANASTGTPAVPIHATRELTLNEVQHGPSTVDGVDYAGGPLEVLLNNTEMPGTDRPDFTGITVGGMTFYTSELPHEGDTELWEIVNTTADAHPIHLHLVQLQILNRQAYDVRKYDAVYAAAFPGGAYLSGYGPPLDYTTGNARALGGNPDVTPYLRGPIRPPAANEAGWKDTIVAYPGQVTRFVVRWAPTDVPAGTLPAQASYPFNPDGGHGYVWHCHILDHEDNEMMRQISVVPNAAARTWVPGIDY